MKISQLNKTPKRHTCQIKSGDHIELFLWLPMNYSFNTCLWQPDYQPDILYGKLFVWQIQSTETDQNSGLLTMSMWQCTHWSLHVMEFLVQILITHPHQFPYSPGLALNELFLFTRLKNHLSGLYFDLDEDTEMIMALRRTSQDFKNCFLSW
jgi:hypothetical protein